MAKSELTILTDYFTEAEDASQTARANAERDRDYVDHKQLTQSEINTLKNRGQPPVQINRLKPMIDHLRGLERKSRTDPKAFPRTPQHDEDAETVTDTLRFIADNDEFDQTKSEAFDNFIIEGVEGCEVVWNPDTEEIELNAVMWDRLVYDPHSRKADFGDAKYKGIVIWMDEDDAITQYPDKESLISGSITNASNSETYDDKPTNWVDPSRHRIRVVQMYYQESGTWMLAHFTEAGFLVDPMESPWIDDKGKPECGLELQSAYSDRNGNRYGFVRIRIDPQDEVNKRRSKSLHLLSQRQTYANARAVGKKDVRQMKGELAKPDGHVEMNAGAEFGKDFGLLTTNDLATGQFNLLQEAKGELDLFTPSGSGIDAAQSGRSRVIEEQTGNQIQLTPLFDGHRAWQTRIYRQAWNRARQFWTGEKWIRVTDDEKNIKWVGLNRPVTAGDKLAEEFGGIPPQFENDPRLSVPVGVENQISEMDVDIILKEVPDVVTIQQEQFEQLVTLYQANPQGIPWELVLEASQLRNKDQLLEKVEGDPEQQAQAAAERKAAEQAVLTAQLENTNAETMETVNNAEKLAADAEKSKAQAFESMMDGLLKKQQLTGQRLANSGSVVSVQ